MVTLIEESTIGITFLNYLDTLFKNAFTYGKVHRTYYSGGFQNENTGAIYSIICPKQEIGSSLHPFTQNPYL
jgi:hypothetical protein